jgi:hypothetical protein
MSDPSTLERNTVSDQILLALGRVEGRLEGIYAQLASGSKRMDAQDHEIAETKKRVDAVENKQAKYAGGLALFCLLLSVAGIVLPLIF